MWFFSIYNKFKVRHWIKLSPGNRQRILEKIEKKQANKQGRQPLSIIVKNEDNWPFLGMFEIQGRKKLLYINKKLVNESKQRFEALETVFHEGRHAFQSEIISQQKSKLSFRARRWQQNYKGYFSSQEDTTIYGFQPIERDAQKYAIKMLKRHRFRFRNEEDYNQTLSRMIKRYENAELQAKKEHGLFYKFKINRKIKKRSKR